MMEDTRFTEFANRYAHAFVEHNVAIEQGTAQLRYCWDSLSETERSFSFNLETLFCIDPQATAFPIAQQVPGDTVVDAFCGAGGMAIALARAGKRVITVERQADRIQMAKHNADIYGVGDQITFVHGDTMQVLPTLQTDAVYLDPLWGADYIDRGVSRFSDFEPHMGELLTLTYSITDTVVLKTPINLDFQELEQLGRSYRQLVTQRFVPDTSLTGEKQAQRQELDSLYLLFT